LKAVATFLTTTQLPNLAKHTLLELARPWAKDDPGLTKLTSYFSEPGKVGRMPVIADQNGIDFDLLPIGAERARLRNANWAQIHDEVLSYADTRLVRPQQLAAEVKTGGAGEPPEDPVPAWRELAKAFRFDGEQLDDDGH
jgi:hypothetical protein